MSRWALFLPIWLVFPCTFTIEIRTPILMGKLMGKYGILNIFCHIGHLIKWQNVHQYWCSWYPSKVHGKTSHMSKPKTHLNKFWPNYGIFFWERQNYAILVHFLAYSQKTPSMSKINQNRENKNIFVNRMTKGTRKQVVEDYRMPFEK